MELFNQMDTPAWSPLYATIAKACELNLTSIVPKQTEETGKNNHRANFYADLDAIRAVLIEWGL